MDTITPYLSNKIDTKGLYLHNHIFYYRKRVKGKLFRKSLNTQNLNDAIRYVKILNKIKLDEKMDFKRNPSFIFEKLDNGFKITQENESDELFLKVIEKFTNTETTQTTNNKTDYVNFETIYNEFIHNKKSLDKVSLDSYRGYQATFHIFKDFFKDKNLNELKTEDKFKLYDYLNSKKIQSKTFNNHLSYLKQFFKYSQNEKILKHNFILNLEMVKEEFKERVNYTDKDLITFLNTDKDFFNIGNFNYSYFFKIAIYTGMRISEIILLTEKEIHNDRIILNQGKTPNAKRTIPLHKELNKEEILNVINHLNVKYKTEQEQEKITKYHTKNANKIIKKFDFIKPFQSFHTLRGTFTQKVLNKNIDKKFLIQLIIGHSLDEKDKLTIQTYAKNIDFEILNKIVQSFLIEEKKEIELNIF